MSEKRTDVNQLGEFGLIDHLTKDVDKKVESTEFGIGDDAAVISISDDTSMLISTDMLIEGVHFNLMYMPLKHLGYKAVAVNVSDICAMNGVAEQITVSIAVSSRFPIEALEELYDGINAACKAYNVDLVGGDTTSSLTGLTISITAIGRAAKKDIDLAQANLICL
jgi:thiamine-monophosphate kinase